MLSLLVSSLLLFSVSAEEEGEVLVLGGQGLAGSATLSALLEAKLSVTVLNDNKNYYDYHELFQGKVESLACLRAAGLSGCFELQNYLAGAPKIRAVVDFTSSSKSLMEEALKLLGPLSPDVYMFVSAAAVYDVAVPLPAPIEEVEVLERPESVLLRETYNDRNIFGNNMLGAEEALRESGLPFVILRCADIVGPRDTTYRWWQYQVWSEHFDIINTGFVVPDSLRNMRFSLTYGGDVAQVILSALQKGVTNRVYNVAMEKPFTLPHYLLEMCKTFNNGENCYADFTEAQETYNLYPSNHQGVLSIERAKEELGFTPTPWDTVLTETVEFYGEARLKFTKERNTVLRKLSDNVVPFLSVGILNEVMTKPDPSQTLDTDGPSGPSGPSSGKPLLRSEL